MSQPRRQLSYPVAEGITIDGGGYWEATGHDYNDSQVALRESVTVAQTGLAYTSTNTFEYGLLMFSM